MMLKRDSDVLFLTVASIVFCLFWVCIYACKYYGLGIDNYDAGIYSNLAYNFANGSPFYSSVLQKNHLGEHFSPIMLVYAPLYWLSPELHWLLGTQIAAWLSVPWLLRLLLLHGFGEKAKGWITLLGLSWLLYQPVTASMNFPFHPSTLAMPFIVWAFYELNSGRWLRMVSLLLFLLAFKENMFLVWIGFGLYLFVYCRKYVLGVVIIAVGAMAGWLILDVVMPACRDGNWQHWSRFGPAYDWMHKFRYLIFLLAPLGFLPLWYWRIGIIALPALLPNLGSQMTQMYSRRHHYDDIVAPLLFCAVAIIIPIACNHFNSHKPKQCRVIACFWVLLALSFVDMTPLRSAWRHLPNHKSIMLINALQTFDQAHSNVFLYAPNVLGPYLHRTLQEPLTEALCKNPKRLRDNSLLVVADLSDYNLSGDMHHIMSILSSHTNTFERLSETSLLNVYRVRQGTYDQWESM